MHINSFALCESESHELEISCNSSSGKAHSNILLMNQRSSGAVSLCNIYTLFPTRDMPPKHWPQSDCLLHPLLQRIIPQTKSNQREGRRGVRFPTEVKAKVRIRFGVCVLWKEVIYIPPYRDPTTGTCWEALRRTKTTCNF